MKCNLNYSRLFMFSIILLFTPTQVWRIIFDYYVHKCNTAFDSIYTVFLHKIPDINNVTYINHIVKYDELSNSQLNIFSTFHKKNSKMLTIKEIGKVKSLKLERKFSNLNRGINVEADQAFKKAMLFKSTDRSHKAKKLLVHALKLDPTNANILAEFGELIETNEQNIVMAEYLCTKAIFSEPLHIRAQECKRRTSPIVEQLDQKRLNQIDSKVLQFYKIPENNPHLKIFKKEQYVSYIYHTTSIEGNTLSLAQTRLILETRLAIGGKSLMEQNEVLGVDLALKYLNNFLNQAKERITLEDILEFHKRILGYVDISEAGHFRKKQVFIADHTPPPADQIPDIMAKFMDWLNSDEITELHPIELAALAHWKLVDIHPFSDGNGRTSRILMNLILMKANYPPCIIRTEDREQYFKLIKIANEDDVRPFIRFIADCTERTLDDFLNTFSDTVNLISASTISTQNLSFYRAYIEQII